MAGQRLVQVGLDVSAKKFDATFQVRGKPFTESHTYDNDPEGHVYFLGKLSRLMGNGRAEVCFESTGAYSLDIALLLHGTDDVGVMVVNPRQISNFRDARGERNKSDRKDSELALVFLQCMGFSAWAAPSAERIKLRYLARRIADLVKLQTQEKNRLHAAEAARDTPELVRKDIRQHLEELAARIETLRREALTLVKGSQEMNQYYRLMISVKGIADVSAIKILSELLVIPAGLKSKQWVAWAGLDPVIYESGTSVHKKPRISKRGSAHLREALYMPALSAANHDPNVRAFYQELQARGKVKMLALSAVMRKLLHSLYGMLKHGKPFDGEKFRKLAA